MDLMLSKLLYALVCVLIPLAWGILVARVFDRLARQLARKRERDEIEQTPGDIEYYI